METPSSHTPIVTLVSHQYAPTPPVYCSSPVTGGFVIDNALVRGNDGAQAPVIEFSGYRFWCFRYSDHRDAICLVAYDRQSRIKGTRRLEGIKDVNEIQSDEGIRALTFIEDGQDDYLQSWSVLFVWLWAGISPQAEDNQLLDMLQQSPFRLSSPHGGLVFEKGRVNLLAMPDLVTGPDLWMIEAGSIIHWNSKLALAIAGDQLVCEPRDAASYRQKWQLTATGALFNVGGQCVVGYEDNSEIPLVVLPSYDVADQHRVAWKLTVAQTPARSKGGLRRATGAMRVQSLEVIARLSGDFWSGTGDTILLALGYPHQVEVLFDSPSRGEVVRKELDFRGMLGKQQVTLSDLAEVDVYQIGNSVYGAAWKLESLELIVNGFCRYSAFKNIDRWFSGVGPRRELVLSWPIYPWAWRNDVNRPFDYTGKTYSVGMLPYIIDLLRWRNYDPATLDGVGQLMGTHNGRLVGENLKTQRAELLEPNSPENSYTWVYTPDGAIIYKLWEHRESQARYVRHSQLASGKPVICAGELRIVRHQNFIELEEVIAKINDASGHYQPDGGACLVPVLQKLQDLGISTQATKLSWQVRT